MKKKSYLFPTQLFEVLVTQNDWDSNPEIVLTIKKFHDLIMDLEADYDFDFGYSDLLAFSKRFSSSQMTVMEEVEIHLHRPTQDILAHLQWYNHLYKAPDSNRIITSWKKIK